MTRGLGDSGTRGLGDSGTRGFTRRWARALTTDFVRQFDQVAPPADPEVHHLTLPLGRASGAVGATDQTGRSELRALWAGTGWREAQAVLAVTVVSQLSQVMNSGAPKGSIKR